MTVVFSDPPPSNKGGAKYAEVYDACRARPGEWAEFPGRPTMSKWNRGFEFTTRGHGSAQKVWTRYVGEPAAPGVHVVVSPVVPSISPASPSASPASPSNISGASTGRPQGTRAAVAS